MIENPIPWRVIRAAPDLLEALEKVDEWFESVRPEDHPPLHLHEAIRVVIAKAKGEKE
jgi:hypothetical protein